MEENNVIQNEEELVVVSEELEEIETIETVSVPVEDLSYLIQVQEHILGTNFTFLLFFFIYCFCSLIHLFFKNF